MYAEINALHEELNGQKEKLGRPINQLEAFRALVDKGGHAEERLASKLGGDFLTSLDARRKRACGTAPLPAEEVRTRYAWVKTALAGAVSRPAQPPATRSDGIDKWVTHWFSGSLIFVALMFIVFQCIFTWAQPVMDLIKNGFGKLGDTVTQNMPDGALQSLINTGIIKGVGSVLVFLPQICLLFLFIAIMEDCGYMARAAFLMDRLLSRVGLSGKSFIPMLSSFACAVPGIMATRTIENWRDRLTTILVAPLMSCSARLPVYTLMILAFIPKQMYYGFLGLRGLTMFAMYFIGVVVAIPVAWILKKTLLKGETPPFLIELPSYKIPDWRGVLLRVLDRGKAFVVRAGTIILAVNIVVWALAYFPHPEAISQRYNQHREMVKSQAGARIDKVNLTPPPKNPADDKSSPLALALTQADKYDTERDTAKRAAAKESDAAKRAELEKAADAKHAESLSELSKVNGIFQIWPQIVEIRDAHQLQIALKQAKDIDTETESKKAELEKESDEAKRAEMEKSIDAWREAELETLSKDQETARIWPRAAEIRDALKAQDDGLDALNNQKAGEYLEQSYFGRMGKAVEPAFKPLGWDWRISMAAIASFPAREVIVATLGTIFSQGSDAKEESADLHNALKSAELPDGRKLFNIPVALSIMVFFALCSQCAATLATIKRETNSWWWPAFSFTYMTALAYLAAWATYQIGMRW